MDYQDIRNIAIIAHVDHGKTTIVDQMMQQTGMTSDGASMDSNALEKERGITIYSKNAAILYRDSKINIVDTPGHADFGSEVERVIRAIDSVILVIDAQEGPMPQTKFVLKKSLDLGLAPIVVINKIDKPAARIDWVHDQVLELFMDLGASDAQLDFPTVFTNAKLGIAKVSLTNESADFIPLFEMILKHVPPASSPDLAARPLTIQPFNLGYDNYLGRLAIGRIYDGVAKVGANVWVKKNIGESRSGKILKIFTFRGLDRTEVLEAQAGDIVLLAGLPDIDIGETICADSDQPALPAITIDEPTISVNFLVNNSPFAGQDGTLVTSRQIRERLERELEVNVGLKIDFSATDHFKVYGRGELHIAVLLENMRREGYELQVSQPQVIFKEEDGVRLEPFMEVTIDAPSQMTGVIIEKLAKRKGQLINMNPVQNYTRMVFKIPTRGLLGYPGEFVIDTSGEGIMSSQVIGFRPQVGKIEKQPWGSMISMMTGKALGFSLFNLQERGTLYIGAATPVYEGMVIGNVSKGNDMTVNPIKGKQLTNMRASGSDEAIALTAPLELTLERGLEIMKADEYLEVTPKNVRLRKQILTDMDRVRARRQK